MSGWGGGGGGWGDLSNLANLGDKVEQAKQDYSQNLADEHREVALQEAKKAADALLAQNGRAFTGLDGPIQMDGTQEVIAKNGRFYYGDKSIPIDDLVAAVMFRQMNSVDGLLGGMIQDMEKSNKDTEEANELLDVLRSNRPDKTSSHVDKDTFRAAVSAAQLKYEKVDGDALISLKFGIEDIYKKSSYKQSDIDQMIEIVKGRISTLNGDQQMRQIRLEKYNNLRNQAYETVSSMIKSVSDTTMDMAHKLNEA